MGFAIPISEASVVAEDLVEYGYVKGRPVIGITSVDVTSSVAKRYGWPEGIWVNSVIQGSGAQEGGLLRGDIIIEANGEKVKSTTELNAVKNKFKPGDNLKLKVYRENKGEITVNVKLMEDNPINSK
jgi:serine protease Do